MMKRFLLRLALSCILICGFLVHCSGADKVDFEALTKSLRAMISDTETKDTDLEEAISRLGKVSEPASFWSEIFNDPNYSLQHRRRCVQALIRRHAPGMTLYYLAVFLDRPKWLLDQHITTVNYVVGYIPVQIEPHDTVFHIRLLPGRERDRTDIDLYIRVAGKVPREDFSRLLRGWPSPQPLPEIAGRPIIEFGFSDIFR